MSAILPADLAVGDVFSHTFLGGRTNRYVVRAQPVRLSPTDLYYSTCPDAGPRVLVFASRLVGDVRPGRGGGFSYYLAADEPVEKEA